MTPDHEALLREVYRAFNARDIDTVLEAMREDVDWPNAMEGGREPGREAVRRYWTRQWGLIDPHVEPVGFTRYADGTIAVRVHQVVHDLAGAVVSDTFVEHVYTFEDGLIARMDVSVG